jgi:hypothetical protein
MEAGIITILLFWLALFHVLPAVLVIGSERVRGKDRDLWLLAVLFTSWLGFVAFLVVTTLEEPSKRAHRAAMLQKAKNLPRSDISDSRIG